MITGLNSTVQFGDNKYHVQTEDCGVDNPVLISTIYLGGEVLGKKKSSYQLFLNSPTFSPQALRKMIEDQHYGIVRAIRSGRVTERYQQHKKTPPRESAANPHVELLSDVLEGAMPPGAHEMRIRIVETAQTSPIANIEVSVEIFGSGIPPQRLQGRTDADGYLNLRLEIPKSHRIAAAMLFRVDHPQAGQELKVLVVKSPS
ncbi:MAG: hypothetical protein PHX83_04900 [Acidobacteriia bacterium]|nr:hypothetical protein [Terriglobia bacterium]